MKKVVSPCFCKVYTRSGNEDVTRAFCEIEFDDTRLSITGVIGPMPSGACRGCAGQCVDEIRKGRPCDEWTQEMLDKFCSIWDEWHLNDMRPYCKHQKELGWDKLAVMPVTLYHYRLNSKTIQRQESIKKSSWKMLCDGMTVALSDDQIEVAKLPYSLTLPHEISGSTETKTLGWLHPEEHPDGILGKPCPVCGYKYGHSWLTEEVPQDVIDWLCSLPESPVEPAWV